MFYSCDIRSFFNLDASRQSSTDQEDDEAYDSSEQVALLDTFAPSQSTGLV